jgi:hypothetical protein
MPEDRSLDEFAGGDGNGGEGSPDGGGDERETGGDGADGGDADGKATTDAVEAVTADGEDPTDAADPVDAAPATSTAAWTTDGAACDRCGESVPRRWFDDGALVCPACKEW